jgi:Reverse transcriptase (RNA-dependent DNA polymerase)
MNIAKNSTKTYDAQLSQAVEGEIEYDLQEAKMFAMVISHIREKIKTRRQKIEVQHVITYSLNKGLKKFGPRAEEVAVKEMQQMIDRDCFEPIHRSELNETEQKQAMESLIFLSVKKDKSIKARHCANGSTQRSYMEREEVSRPTVSTESTMLTAVIEAAEGRDVATCDIPNAFIQTEVEEADKDGNRIIMKICGVLVDLLKKVVPEYEACEIEEAKGKVLYLPVKKAIYGMLESALLFYKKLSGDLVGYGFNVNPHDPCVANKEINHAQLTVSWHVDDLKISHRDAKVVSYFVEWIKQMYGKISEVKVKRGKVHDYLGMKLHYDVQGQVSIDMIDYVQNMLEGFPQNQIEKASKTPWNDNLFKVESKSVELSDSERELFHTVVAQGLFLCKRARPDISPAIAFLTTRVQHPTREDWIKLVKLMRYLKGMVHDVLTLRADGSGVMKWYTSRL